MKKKFFSILLFIMLGLCVFGLIGCNESTNNPDEYSVKFSVEGTVIVTETYTADDTDIIIPEVPEKTGYVGKWEEFDFNNTNLVVKAIYTPIVYNVIFKAGEQVISTETYTVENKNISAPSVPIKDGYFGKWEEYTLTYGDIVVSAVYDIRQYSVQFVADNKIIATKNYTIENMKVDAPLVPEKNGYIGQWETYTLEKEDIIVNAIYTAKEYSIKFNADGQIVKTEKYTVETTNIATPEIPVKVGYVGKWEEFDLTYTDIVVNAVYVEIKTWDGVSCSEGFFGGNGSVDSPYLIATPEDLRYLSKTVNEGANYAGKYFKLLSNLDLGGFEWTPIGYGNSEYSKTFNGVFDGNELSISNYKISTLSNVSYSEENIYYQIGLFGYIVNAQIVNLTVDNVVINVETESQDGDIYVYVGGVVGLGDNAIISKSNFNGEISAKSYKPLSYFTSTWVNVGGIAGNMEGTISYCSSSGNIKGNGSYSRTGGICGSGLVKISFCDFNGQSNAPSTAIGYAGGIIGYSSSDKIDFCNAQGEITSNGEYAAYSGGIAGIHYGAKIFSCSANCEIISRTGDDANIGGICGSLEYAGGKIENCEAFIITKIDDTGNYERYCVGGIVGYINKGSIKNSISRGSMSVKTTYADTLVYVGGVCGYIKGFSEIEKIEITNCLTDCELFATTASDDIIAKIYREEYCKVENVSKLSEVSLSTIQSLGFAFFENNDLNNLNNGKVWAWNEENEYLYLFIDELIPTSYTINIYQETLDGEYELVDSKTVNSMSNIIVTPSLDNFDGFITPNLQSVRIKDDGSTTFEYQYDRERYSFYLIANNGQKNSVTVKYGEIINSLQWATKNGLTLGGWYYDLDLTQPFDVTIIPNLEEEYITLYAWWKEENKPSDFMYNLYDSLGYGSVSLYIGSSDTVIVPSYIGGIKITQISWGAFRDNEKLTSVTLPTTITEIGAEVFRGCTNLENISVPFIGKNSTIYPNYLNTEHILGYFFEIQEVLDTHTPPVDWVCQGTIIKSAREYGVYANIPKTLSRITITVAESVSLNACKGCNAEVVYE